VGIIGFHALGNCSRCECIIVAFSSTSGQSTGAGSTFTLNAPIGSERGATRIIDRKRARNVAPKTFRRKRWSCHPPAEMDYSSRCLPCSAEFRDTSCRASLPKRFTSQTLVLVQQPAVSPDLVPTLISDNVNQRLAAMQQQILSRSRLEPVIQELGLYHKDINRLPMEDLVEQLRRTITITPIQPMAETRAQNLPGFTISVVFDDPHTTQANLRQDYFHVFGGKHSTSQGRGDQHHRISGKAARRSQSKTGRAGCKNWPRSSAGISDRFRTRINELNLLTGLTSQLEASTQALSRAQQDKKFRPNLFCRSKCPLGRQLSQGQIPKRSTSNWPPCKHSWLRFNPNTPTIIPT